MFNRLKVMQVMGPNHATSSLRAIWAYGKVVMDGLVTGEMMWTMRRQQRASGLGTKGTLVIAKGTSWIISEHLLRFYVQKELKRGGMSLCLLRGAESFRRRRIE